MHLNLMWFRSDLRVHDNPALSAACSAGPCLAVYCLTPEQWRQHDVSFWKLGLIRRHLPLLAEDLARLNIPLLVLDCGRFDAIPERLTALAQQHGVQAVYWNHEYELNERRCARQVRQSLAAQGIAARTAHDQCVIRPGRVLTQTGSMFKVFTAFRRAYVHAFAQEARSVFASPAIQPALALESSLQPLKDWTPDAPVPEAEQSERWPAGEAVALARLEAFTTEPILHYDQQRDLPAQAGTSMLSPWLAIGALSTTQCLYAALAVNQGRLESGNKGVETWITELIWRDFYRHLLVAYPDLCRHQSFQPDTDRLPWRQDARLFAAWCGGRTGYPIVDAAMRQLNTTGWMHNRLRMITAMFLTKHLFIDWRLGERYFMQHLVDGDLASNNGGWQWSASTGVDAAPYFRIFNPARQSERFDTKGDFIRRFVPELAGLDARSIHQPSMQQALDCGYPLPIVQHAPAVADAKRWFKELSPTDVRSSTPGRCDSEE